MTGKDRATVIAQYQMVLEKEGWKIDGVAIMEELQPIGLPDPIFCDPFDFGKNPNGI